MKLEKLIIGHPPTRIEDYCCKTHTLTDWSYVDERESVKGVLFEYRCTSCNTHKYITKERLREIVESNGKEER